MADRKRDDADRHHFQLFTNRVDFLHLQGRQSANQRAAIGDALHQALLFELEEGQPDVAAMGLEQVTKILLDQAFPRLTPPQYDILLDALCDDEGCRFPRGRWYLTGSGRSGYCAFGWFSDHNSPDLEAPRRPGAANGPTGWYKPSIMKIISATVLYTKLNGATIPKSERTAACTAITEGKRHEKRSQGFHQQSS